MKRTTLALYAIGLLIAFSAVGLAEESLNTTETMMTFVTTVATTADYTTTTFPDTTTTVPDLSGKVIIFRNDNLQAWWNFFSLVNITNTLIENEIPQTIGIIPNATGGYSIGSDPEFKSYLESIKYNPYAEFALNGYRHNPNEFGDISLDDAEKKISKGIEIFSSELGMHPTTFIVPYDEFNENTLLACKNNGINVFSSGARSDPDAWNENPEGLFHIPSTVDFYCWENNTHIPSSVIKSNCQDSLDENGVCVFVLHHWLFTDDDSSINETTYQNLLDVLSWVKQKESYGAQLMTMNQYRNSIYGTTTTTVPTTTSTSTSTTTTTTMVNSYPEISDWGVDNTSIEINRSTRINATVTDDSGIQEVRFYIETPYGSLNETAESSGSHYYLICNSTNLCGTNMPGQYNITSIWANSTEGLETSESIDLSFTVSIPSTTTTTTVPPPAPAGSGGGGSIYQFVPPLKTTTTSTTKPTTTTIMATTTSTTTTVEATTTTVIESTTTTMAEQSGGSPLTGFFAAIMNDPFSALGILITIAFMVYIVLRKRKEIAAKKASEAEAKK